MGIVGKLLRWLAAAFAFLVVALLAAFGLLQTQFSKTWLERETGQLLSAPDSTVAISGLGGLVPFRMTITQIDLGDRDGTYLTLRDAAIDISPIELLSRRLHIRSLDIADIEMARPSTAPSTTPFTDYLKVPRLPVAVVLDRLSITRLALAPPVMGESLVATIAGNAELAGGTAHIALDLHRTDSSSGNVQLAMDLSGETPVLNLRLEASEPTGALLDRLLNRDDRPALALSLNGRGPIADWHGRLTASAGALARVDADLALAVKTETVIGVSGTTEMAPLLPAEFAPLAGDRIGFSLHAGLGERIVVDDFSIEMAAGAIAGDGAYGGPEQTVAAHLHADIPQLSAFAGLLGQPLEGSGTLAASVTGTERQPALELTLSGSGVRVAGSGAERIEAEVHATPMGDISAPDTRIDVAASGRVEGLIPPEGVAVPPELGRDLDWSLAAAATRDGRNVELTRLSAAGIGVTLAGSGRLTDAGAIEGSLGLTIADLRPFSGLAGHTLAGSLKLEANAEQEGAAGFKARLDGAAAGLLTGIPIADALLGASPTITGAARRDASGTLIVDRLDVTGAAVKLSGGTRFDPAANTVAGSLVLDLPRLKPLGPALGTELTGAVSAHVDAEGPVDHLRLRGDIVGNEITGAGAQLDRLQLAADVPDIAEPRLTLDGNFRSSGLDGKLALTAEQRGPSELVVPRLQVTAADSRIDGSLQVVLDTGLVKGSVTGRAPDLAAWSRLAGTPLGGNIEFDVGLDARNGQSLDLLASGSRLAFGTGASRIAIGRLDLAARFADILRLPSGTGRLSLTSASMGSTQFATASLTLDAPRPGHFVFQTDAKGQPLTLAMSGDGSLAAGGMDLRLNRLAGSFGPDRFLLEQPLLLSKHGRDLAFSGLAFDYGTGRITGNGAVKGESLALALNGANLPIGSAARLAGYPRAQGALNLGATLAGTFRSPQGHFSVNARDLTLASKHSQLVSLGITADGNWNGRSLDVNGRVTGLKGDQVSFGGSVPVLLRPAPLGVSVPPDGRLALQLQGGGRIEQLADLLPLGEDRVSGRFDANVTVGGTVAAPAANGRIRLSDARYENFATGAVLTNMQADVVGNRDRLTLTSFSASDTASGTLKAQGNVVLGGANRTVELSASLANFRVAARDEAVATATGSVSIAGPLTAPKVTAPLTIDRADISLPDSLPPSVVVIKVTEVNGKTGRPAAPPAPAQAPALPVPLDITIDMPRNIFVRGHGLDSEWRGHLKITGTSDAPKIAGSLEQIRGSVDLLGKTFTLTRSTITFDGSGKMDPTFDIVAEASAADITAQVTIGGTASAPTIALSSTPPVPQDEILSRVLFNNGVGQLTAAQGIQLAAAAATLAGGGPGVLDKLRGGLGLDWFNLGSGPGGPATTSFNPKGTSGGTGGGTALSAGKSIAPGVSIGVSQGLSPPTSKVTVEIDVWRHVTVQGEAGQSGSTGLGVNYNYDY
jgi:translocation and assembly module TamB